MLIARNDLSEASATPHAISFRHVVPPRSVEYHRQPDPALRTGSQSLT
jgi:hypothetical protein